MAQKDTTLFYWILFPKTPYSFFFVARKEKSLIERTIQNIKNRTESFDDYFTCITMNCKLKHVINWMNLFVEYYNKKLETVK
jgi:hypothetical protein